MVEAPQATQLSMSTMGRNPSGATYVTRLTKASQLSRYRPVANFRPARMPKGQHTFQFAMNLSHNPRVPRQYQPRSSRPFPLPTTSNCPQLAAYFIRKAELRQSTWRSYGTCQQSHVARPDRWLQRIQWTRQAAYSATGDHRSNGLLCMGGDLWPVVQRTFPGRSRWGFAHCRRSPSRASQSRGRPPLDAPPVDAIAHGACCARGLLDSIGVRHLLSLGTNAGFGWHDGAGLSKGSH